MSNTPKDNSIAEQYSKEYKKYQRRISEAQKSGIDIPEKFIIPKVKRPTAASIERIKRVTRQTIIQDIKQTEYQDKKIAARRGYYAINPETSERIVHQNKLPEFYGIEMVDIPDFYVHRSRTDPNRPLNLSEVLEISKKVIDEKNSVPYQLDEHEITDIVFEKIKEMRGPEFREDAFLAQEEKYKGFTTKDASRKLDRQERSYIKTLLDDAKEAGKNIDYAETVSSLRAMLPDFDIRDQILEEEEQEHPAYMDFTPIEKEEQYKASEDGYDFNYNQNTNTKNDNNSGSDDNNYTSHDSEYTYEYDAVMELLQTITVKSRYANDNRIYAIGRLKGLAGGTSKKAVSYALSTLQGEVGLFDIDLLYKREALNGFLDAITSLALAFEEAQKMGHSGPDLETEDAIRTEFENGEDYLL